VRRTLARLGIEEIVIAACSPWHSPYIERLIGSLRRECLDHLIILHERHLRRIVADYLAYYHEARPHLSLDRNAPVPREVEPPAFGRVVGEAMVGGLHHRYRRVA
jgi:transposase InsO family protein